MTVHPAHDVVRAASPRLRPLFNVAQRLGRGWNTMRTRMVRNGDYVAQVVAYRGYGTTSRVRSWPLSSV